MIKLKFKRRMLKTLPWAKMSVQLQQAAQDWVDSGGDPKHLARVETLTKAIRKAAKAETPGHRKSDPSRLPGYMRDDMSLFGRIVVEAKDSRRKPGSVKWPKGHGDYGKDPSKKLLPGDAEFMSKAQLGSRSHQQRLARSGNRFVTFSNGIAEKVISVIESTPRRAVAAARKKSRLNKSWTVTKVDGVKWTGPQK